MSKSWKAFITVEDRKVMLMIQQTDSNEFTPQFSALSDLTYGDIDILIVRLREEQETMTKLQVAIS